MKQFLNNRLRAATGLILAVLSMNVWAADNVTVDIDWSRVVASESQFALPQAVSLSSALDGSRSAGGKFSTWSLTVTVPGAISTSFTADQVKLPAGTTLTIQGGDGVKRVMDTTLGPAGKLWSRIVQGDTFTVVASVPTPLMPKLSFHLFEVQGGYKQPFATGAQVKSAGAGNQENYACVQDSINIYAARATAAIVINNSLACTGSLVNDGAGDFKEYFLTASHCAGKTNLSTNDYVGSAQSITAYWGAQTPCGQQLGSASSDATATTTGATHRARSGDVWLVELTQPVPATAYYEGFDASGDPVTNIYAVHHGNALDRQWMAGADNNSGASAPLKADGEMFMVAGGSYTDGISTPGASGSGVVNAASQRLLGVLHGAGPAQYMYSTLSDVYTSGFSTYLGSGLTTNGAEPPPPPPSVMLSANTTFVTVGNSLTLTWSSNSVNGCTASASPTENDWTGSLATNGSASVTPPATGSVTYMVTCTGGSSNVSSQAIVQVQAVQQTPPPSSGSGGSAMDLAGLLMLLAGVLRKRILGLHAS